MSTSGPTTLPRRSASVVSGHELVSQSPPEDKPNIKLGGTTSEGEKKEKRQYIPLRLTESEGGVEGVESKHDWPDVLAEGQGETFSWFPSP